MTIVFSPFSLSRIQLRGETGRPTALTNIGDDAAKGKMSIVTVLIDRSKLRDYIADMRRRAASIAAILVVFVLALAVVESYRPRVPPTTTVEETRPQPASESDFARFREPAAFEELCQLLQRRYIAMDERYRGATHTQVRVTKELDGDGNVIAAEETVEEVSFEEVRERRTLLRKRDLLNNAPAASIPQQSSAGKESNLIYPFSKNDVEGLYQFKWNGTETIDGTPAVQIAYEPVRPQSDLLAGTVSVNPDTGEPVRFSGRMVQPPMFVDRFEMTVHYGRSENGENQIRRIVTDGSGGFALIRKHYHVETEFLGYR